MFSFSHQILVGKAWRLPLEWILATISARKDYIRLDVTGKCKTLQLITAQNLLKFYKGE